MHICPLYSTHSFGAGGAEHERTRGAHLAASGAGNARVATQTLKRLHLLNIRGHLAADVFCDSSPLQTSTTGNDSVAALAGASL